MKPLCVGWRIGPSFRISGELVVFLMTLSKSDHSDSDGFLGLSRRHRWYSKTATQVLGVKLIIALFLRLLKRAKGRQSSRSVQIKFGSHTDVLTTNQSDRFNTRKESTPVIRQRFTLYTRCRCSSLDSRPRNVTKPIFFAGKV
jgi:hypothetical protein